MIDRRSSNALGEPGAREEPPAAVTSRDRSSTCGPPAGASPLRAALWTLGDRLVTLVLGAVMTAQLARYLDVGGYGYYGLVMTFVMPFVLITDLASAQVVVREIAGRPEQTRRVIATALLLRALLGVIAMLACVLRAWSMDYPTPVRTAIVVYSVTLLLAPAEALAAILQARLRLGAISLIGAGATLVNLVLILAAVRAHAALPLVLAAAAAPAIVRAAAVTILVWLWVYRPSSLRSGSRLSAGRPLSALGSRRSQDGLFPSREPRAESREPPYGAFDTVLARRLLAASWPLALATLLNLVPGSLPTFCLATRPIPLGTFGAAKAVPMMLALIPNAVMVGLFPVMARAYLAGPREATAVLHRAYIALLGLAFPISAGAVALAPDGVRLLYGHAFAASVPGLRLLSLTLIAMFPGIGAGHMLIAMGREKVNLTLAVGGAALAALLTPWLCQEYGANGAAVAVAAVTVAMAATSTACAWWFLRTSAGTAVVDGPSSLQPLCLPVTLRRIVGCALVMTGVVLVLRRAGLFVAMGGGAAFYAFCVWKTGLLEIAIRFPSLEALSRRDRGETETPAAGGGGPGENGPFPHDPRSPSPPVGDVPRRDLAQRLRCRLDANLAAAFWRVCYWRCKAVRGARCAVRGESVGMPLSQAASPRSCRTAHCAPGTAHRERREPTILVLDRDYVGDVVCITPALRALRERFPAAVITLAVAPGVAPLFAAHPHVDRVVALGEGRGLLGAWRLMRELSALAPQSIVVGLGTVPANAWLGHLAGALCRAEVRLGEAYGDTAGLLTHPVTRTSGVRHWTHIHLDVLAPLGIDPADRPAARPFMVTAPEDRAAVQQFVESYGPLPRPWIALHPGGRIYRIPDAAAPEGLATLSRRWPAERFAVLARRLLDARGGTLFLTGGPEDVSVTLAVLAAFGARSSALGAWRGQEQVLLLSEPSPEPRALRAEPCIDTTGRLSLGETAALIEACDLFVTNDTGPMHLAFALDVPTVAIFGPTDPRRAGPLDHEDLGRAEVSSDRPPPSRHRVLRPALACSPCAGEALVPCRNPAGQECLTAVSVAAAYAAAIELLRQTPDASRQTPVGTGDRERGQSG
jgi:heptosyltransferase-2